MTVAVYTELYPSTDGLTSVCESVSSGAQEALLTTWITGEVAARGFTPAWTPALRWWVERLAMTYRNPIAPDPTPVGPTTGQIWPR